MIFTERERRLMADAEFFPLKAAATDKVKAALLQLRDKLKAELAAARLPAPEGADLERGQLVKGEHLLDFPYQYLDFPKCFSQGDMLTFRTLFWWGHHVTFALMLGGRELARYKANLLARYDDLADHDLHLLMTQTPWEWRRGADYLLPLLRGNRERVAAALADRPFLKIHRILDFEHPALKDGTFAAEGRTVFRLMARIAEP
ncbi:MAG: hypothetical protein AB1515_01975 [Nitrospirota bacterium]